MMNFRPVWATLRDLVSETKYIHFKNETNKSPNNNVRPNFLYLKKFCIQYDELLIILELQSWDDI